MPATPRVGRAADQRCAGVLAPARTATLGTVLAVYLAIPVGATTRRRTGSPAAGLAVHYSYSETGVCYTIVTISNFLSFYLHLDISGGILVFVDTYRSPTGLLVGASAIESSMSELLAGFELDGVIDYKAQQLQHSLAMIGRCAETALALVARHRRRCYTAIALRERKTWRTKPPSLKGCRLLRSPNDRRHRKARPAHRDRRCRPPRRALKPRDGAHHQRCDPQSRRAATTPRREGQGVGRVEGRMHPGAPRGRDPVTDPHPAAKPAQSAHVDRSREHDPPSRHARPRQRWH